MNLYQVICCQLASIQNILSISRGLKYSIGSEISAYIAFVVEGEHPRVFISYFNDSRIY
jgi:hypothetical protein